MIARIAYRVPRLLAALVAAGAVLHTAAWARTPQSATQSATQTEIRRTAYGIPHIRAASERGLGYGIGYAYAQDNLCLLADDVTTVNGERSLHFGPQAEGAAGMPNLQSDAFFRWLNQNAAVDAFLAAQPAPVRDLMRGYADGYNRYLADTAVSALPAPCGGQAWLRPITDRDLARLTRRLLIEGGVAPFAQAVVGAAPPVAEGGKPGTVSAIDPAEATAADARLADAHARYVARRGSNAMAVGGALSANGRGLLLGNPHFPWSGTLRFYQMHLTIPGRLDVMGAALPGLPVVNIGFTRHVAWTHTVDASAHFTLYRLQLDPHDPTAYLVDGKREPMRRITVAVPVKGPDGKVIMRSHAFFETRYGPVLNWPGRFGWTQDAAFAIRDANLDNTRVLAQWHAMAQARSLDAFQATIGKTLGIPWVNTLAVGDAGANAQALYMNVSVIPNVDGRRWSACGMGDGAGPVRVLDGSRQACAWGRDAGAPAPGIVAASNLPVLRRTDFVQNANDSAWLANPASPLTGFPGVVSRQDVPLGLRARRVLDWIGQRAGQRIGADDLASLVMDDRAYAADLVLDDVLALCRQAGDGADADAITACQALAGWDRTAGIGSSAGYLYFEAFMDRVNQLPSPWAVPFDPRQPLTTPRGLALASPEARQALLAALSAAGKAVRDQGVAPDARWGAVQVATRGDRAIPIHGGRGELGVYNVIESRPSGPGRREVFSGSSYIQVVSFGSNGPHARTLLTFSQSANLASPHAADQTELFSQRQWVDVPFTEAAIRADRDYQRLVLDMTPGTPRRAH
ncbi:bifunctional acylase PvdQ [Cupriavidus pauculus]|uniref:Acylase n=1 Tax=Cupriavidus pauculus TaxID=82633 RepID=A0A2N5CD87_9BURK|nr:acylase [Cupriavidus pauculus]PLQ00213.1 acylase [Cupriavidus pauculus]